MRRRVAAARVGHLGTVGPDGLPHVVAFCFAVESDRLFSAVDQKPKSTRELRRLANIRSHPEVTVLVDHYEEDWSALWWVRLRGRAEIVDDGPMADRGRELLSGKYDQYRREQPTGPVIAVQIERWTGWTP